MEASLFFLLDRNFLSLTGSSNIFTTASAPPLLAPARGIRRPKEARVRRFGHGSHTGDPSSIVRPRQTRVKSVSDATMVARHRSPA